MTSQTIPLGPPAKLEARHCGLEPGALRLRDGASARPSSLALAPGHRPILDALDGLLPDEAIRINVDHDPSPLLEFVELTAPGRYGWEPLLEGPRRWVGLLRRRSPALTTAARVVPPRLASRAAAIGARPRLERAIRGIVLDLLGPGDAVGLSSAASAWASATVESVVGAVRDGSLAALLATLDGELRAADPAIIAELRAARDRRDMGAL